MLWPSALEPVRIRCAEHSIECTRSLRRHERTQRRHHRSEHNPSMLRGVDARADCGSEGAAGASLGGRIAGRNLQASPSRTPSWVDRWPEGAVAAERLPLAEPSFSSVIADLDRAMAMAPGALGVTRPPARSGSPVHRQSLRR